ncbi:histidinol-phosphate transaminase [Olsenella sp. Marseille-P4559]|uniref:histidinol-phosphate transaminase n=1 Tax=Olsenella sp. Marseille-P4559 TaxID=2364795 RepID=UPI0010311DAB|nr:histidinol-phosphate transaminase [Olsenella sp. Marseille-P4559]
MAGIAPEVRALMRPSAAALDPYDPAFSPVDVILSANENNYGIPPEVAPALAAAVTEAAWNRYPVPLGGELRSQIAAWHNVAPERVIIGNGGDELLFNFFLAFGGAGHALVSCPPTFSVYGLYASMVETPVIEVAREKDFAPNVDALVEAARTAMLVVVTSPNNPTGDLFPRDGVRRLCEACPGIVLVDEAYMEFADPGSSVEGLLPTYDNLAVLHTFSKAFALAGARVGYVLASAPVVAALAAVRQPYSVSVLDQAAALAAVTHRDAFLPAIEAIRMDRTRLSATLAGLASLGVRVWPSQANFICVRVPHARDAWRRLRDERSILVRDFSSTPGLEDCLRITVGKPEENDLVVGALTSILKGE